MSPLALSMTIVHDQRTHDSFDSRAPRARIQRMTLTYSLPQATEVLRRTPATLEALLAGLDDGWTRQNEGGESWSPHAVLGHLIHGERTDWIPRVRIVLDSGESRPFEPFDRFAMLRTHADRTVDELLAEFRTLREESLATLAGLGLTDADLERTGRHPELGTVTLRALLASWVVHDLGHLGQIARVMARQYGSEVGPWKRYLTILTR
jgi:uncharacterized damage-inducible protein DinB